MATNIKNKAGEVAAWIERRKLGRTPTAKELQRYVEDRWPELNARIREDIVLAAMAQTF